MDTNPYETGSCTPVPSIAPQRRCVIGLLLFSNRLDWWVRTRGVSALGRFPDRFLYMYTLGRFLDRRPANVCLGPDWHLWVSTSATSCIGDGRWRRTRSQTWDRLTPAGTGRSDG